MSAFSEALEIVGRDGVDLERPWCRSVATVALQAFARAAFELNRTADLVAMLKRWRSVYVRWSRDPITPDEAEYVGWYEQVLEHADRCVDSSPRGQ